LNKVGEIPVFDLGTHDHPIVLRFWHSKIYGRGLGTKKEERRRRREREKEKKKEEKEGER
jgi:hypothetical protein